MLSDWLSDGQGAQSPHVVAAKWQQRGSETDSDRSAARPYGWPASGAWAATVAWALTYRDATGNGSQVCHCPWTLGTPTQSTCNPLIQ